MDDPTQGERGWGPLMATLPDRPLELWAWFTAPSSIGIALLGGLASVYAIYASDRYRALLIAAFGGAVPLTLLLGVVADPLTWSYLLLLLHIGTAIALHYLLKVLGDHWPATFGVHRRIGIGLLLVLLALGPSGLRAVAERIPRFGEAAKAAAWCKENTVPGDRLVVVEPWDTPVEFHLLAEGVGNAVLAPTPGSGKVYVLVGKRVDHGLMSVLERSPYRNLPVDAFERVEDWRRLEIFAAR